MTIIGTRPEIIRLSRVLPKMDNAFDHTVVYTNQNFDYELSKIFFEQLNLRQPDRVLEVKADTLGGQIANIMTQTEAVLDEVKPQALLVLGDTNSCLSAVLARRKGMIVFHMEAGNRSFDWQVPEELNRRIVDHISNVNLAYTEHARRYLLREGIHPGSIFVTGSPLTEVIDYYLPQIEQSDILGRLNLTAGEYFLISAHREENVDNPDRRGQLLEALGALASTYQIPVIVSTHPRTKKRLDESGEALPENVRFEKPFGFIDYNRLQKNAKVVLSDSGSVPEEAAILGFKAVQIRVSQERPEAYDTGTLTLSGISPSAVLSAVKLMVESETPARIPDDYRDKNVSDKVVRLILGQTSIALHHGLKPLSM